LSNQIEYIVFLLKRILIDGMSSSSVRGVLRYQRGNQNPQIEEGQTTQLSKEKRTRGHNYLQNTTQKTAERAPQTPLKSGDELVCSGSAKVPKSAHTSSINF
jgi:hypothetical protein